jgi:thiol-disulfide isomerase/thioredoxin
VRSRGLLPLLALLALVACKGDRKAPPKKAAVRRFAAVEAAPAKEAESRFCERVYPPTGTDARPYKPPPIRATLNDGANGLSPGAKAWTWVNVWATWCAPCMDEMALLGRWRDALQKDGVPVRLTLLSVDDPKDEDALKKAVASGLSGPVPWLRSPDDLPAFLEGLGVDKTAALPVHALVDADNHVRCVRIGAIHDRDYGAVKAMLSGG